MPDRASVFVATLTGLIESALVNAIESNHMTFCIVRDDEGLLSTGAGSGVAVAVTAPAAVAAIVALLPA